MSFRRLTHIAKPSIEEEDDNMNCKSMELVKPPLVFIKSLCTLPSDHANIASVLISIFTKQPFCSHNPELKSLAPFLNTHVVETALNGFKSWKLAHFFFNWASTQYGYRHNMYTYNAMASILSRARQNAPMKVLSVDILNSRCSMSPGALGFLMRCFGSVGLVDEANMLFDEVKRLGLCVPNSYSYNCLLEAISKSSSIDLVEMRLKEMQDHGWQFDKYTLTPVLLVYCNAGKFDKALGIFNEIYNRGWVDAHIYSIMALSFSKWGEVDKAFELIERMQDQGIRLNEKTFSVLTHGFVKESRMDNALLLFNKMKQSGFAPDVSHYDVLIGGFCANNDLDEALNLYMEMKELGIQPDFGIITKLISSFSEVGESTRLLKAIRKDMDVEALTLLFNSVLHYLVTNGSIKKAYHLLKSMMGHGCDDDSEIDELSRDASMVPPNTTSFSIVINALLKNDKLDLALGLFQDMVQIGCKQDLLLYNNLIDGLCNSNRLEEGYKLLGEMEKSGIKPSEFTHNSILGCLCKRADVSHALDLVKKMRIHGHNPWIKHSTLLVKELCKCGKALEACKFLDDMVQEGFLPDIIPYSAAMNGLIEIQEVDQALKLFQVICAHGYCPDVIAYNTLIKGLCKAQRITEAQDIMNEMMMKSLVPSIVTYNMLIDGWCKNGHIKEAMLCLSKMFVAEREPNVVTYTTLIDGLCKAGRSDDAIMLWNEMGRKGCSPSSVAFMAFICGLCKCGRPNEALVHLHEMEEKEMTPDSYVYAELLSAFLANLDLPMAFEILKNMVDRGNLPDLHEKNYVIIREAIHKLSEDVRTSSGAKDLIANGSIPERVFPGIGREGV